MSQPRQIHRPTRESQDGAIFFEFSLVLPLLLLLYLGGVSVARTLRALDQLTFISRVAALQTVRSCTQQYVLDEPPTVTYACLSNVADQVIEPARSIFPEQRIILSIYTYDQDTNSVALQALRYVGPSIPACRDGEDNDLDGHIDDDDPNCSSTEDDNEAGGPIYATKFNPNVVQGLYYSAITKTGNLVIAETFSPQSGNFGFFTLLEGSRYAASIF